MHFPFKVKIPRAITWEDVRGEILSQIEEGGKSAFDRNLLEKQIMAMPADTFQYAVTQVSIHAISGTTDQTSEPEVRHTDIENALDGYGVPEDVIQVHQKHDVTDVGRSVSE